MPHFVGFLLCHWTPQVIGTSREASYNQSTLPYFIAPRPSTTQQNIVILHRLHSIRLKVTPALHGDVALVMKQVSSNLNQSLFLLVRHLIAIYFVAWSHISFDRKISSITENHMVIVGDLFLGSFL